MGMGRALIGSAAGLMATAGCAGTSSSVDSAADLRSLAQLAASCYDAARHRDWTAMLACMHPDARMHFTAIFAADRERIAAQRELATDLDAYVGKEWAEAYRQAATPMIQPVPLDVVESGTALNIDAIAISGDGAGVTVSYQGHRCFAATQMHGRWYVAPRGVCEEYAKGYVRMLEAMTSQARYLSREVRAGRITAVNASESLQLDPTTAPASQEAQR